MNDCWNNRTLSFLAVILFSVLQSTGTAQARTQAFFNLSQVNSTTDWDSIFDSDTDHGMVFGVSLTGPDAYSRNDNLAFAPASNTKLFTAAAVFKYIGTYAPIPTPITWYNVDSNNAQVVTGLTLIGNGDPTWGMSEFGEDFFTRVQEIASNLSDRGVTQILGPITLQPGDPRWNDIGFPESWLPEDQVGAYGAQAQAFSMNANSATYTISTPTHGAWNEPGVPIPVTLDIAWGSTTDLTVLPITEGTRQAASFIIRGTLKRNASLASRTFALPVHDASGWVKALLTRAIKLQGISLDESSQPPTHSNLQKKFISESPPMALMMAPFLKESINVMGEAFLKLLGQMHPDTTLDLQQAGLEVLNHFTHDLGVAATFYDGSGISHQNQVTPAAVLALLNDLKGSEYCENFWDALPIAGIDGTLANRMVGTAAEGVVRAKTGTLTGVYNLSGYVPQFDQASGEVREFFPFVMLTQAEPMSGVPAHQIQDQVASRLVQLINSKR